MASLILQEHPDHELLFAHEIITNSDTAHIFLATAGEANPEDYRGNGYAAEGRRTEESYATLGAFGIAAERVHRGILRDGSRLLDGELKSQSGSLAGALYNVLTQHEEITEIVSLGEDGFDGHPDHVTGYEVARSLVKTLQYSRRLEHRVLVRPGSGSDLVRTGDEQTKLTVIEHHISPWGGLRNHQKVNWLRDEYLGSFTEEHYRYVPLSPLKDEMILAASAVTKQSEYMAAA